MARKDACLRYRPARLTITVTTISIFIMFSMFLQENINAQNTSMVTNTTGNKENGEGNNNNTFIVAIIGIIGTLTGSILSSRLTNKHNLEKDKKERQFLLIKQKINLYSFFIYYTEVFVRFAPKGEEGKIEMKKAVEGIDSDSHKPNDFEFLKFGIAQARRGWAKKSDILNTLPSDKLLKNIK
jgi:hypothetical protein